MASKVGTKGQVVIEKELRDRLGVKPGHLVVQRIVDDHVEMRFHPPEHDRSVRGALSRAARRTVPPHEWREVKEQAWSEAAVSTEEQNS
jgi:AbrB family looped-hinge helix DNA binding protein